MELCKERYSKTLLSFRFFFFVNNDTRNNKKRKFFSNHLGHDFSAKDIPKPGVA